MDLTSLLNPLTPAAGTDLRLVPVFDDLKELRREDDHDVSYGIWSFELKVAHWDRLEGKTYELLTTQTKDLEILLWYIECLIQRYKIQGLSDGVTLLNEFCKKFWDTFFPLDAEHRGALLEVFDRHLADHVLRLNLCGHPDYIVTLLNWKNAQHMNNLLARDSSLEQELMEEYGMSLDIIRNRLGLVTPEFVKDMRDSFQSVVDTLKDFVALCDAKIPQAEVGFIETLKVLAEVQYVLTKEVVFHKPAVVEEEDVKADDPPQVDLSTIQRQIVNNNSPIKDRTDVYAALQELSDYLQQTEPHSPVPAILHMLINWRDKTLPDIIDDVQRSPEHYRTLYAIVGR